MRNGPSASSSQITSKVRSLVKWALGTVPFFFVATHCCLAADPATPKTYPEDPVFSDDELPQIEARKFDVRVSRISRSKTVYLLDDETSARPSPGKILLLKRETTPMMAFRVLKLYEERRQLAARRIRLYGGILQLDTGESFEAIEKLADIVPVPPSPETIAEDKKELDDFEDELEAETGEVWSDPAPVGGAVPSEKERKKKKEEDDYPPAELVAAEYDPELDSESSPPPSGDGSAYDEELLGDEANAYGIASDDGALLEPDRHMISAGAGWVFNRLRSDAVYNAGGIRYSYTFKRLMLLQTSRLQDALSWEGSMFLYKPIYNEGSYTVIPWTGTLRYDISSKRGFTFYFYGGVVFNGVMQGPVGTSQAAIDLAATRAHDLYGVRPAGGIGLLFPFGPNWNFRANLGADSIDFALALRF